jgi:hypothetical protein
LPAAVFPAQSSAKGIALHAAPQPALFRRHAPPLRHHHHHHRIPFAPAYVVLPEVSDDDPYDPAMGSAYASAAQRCEHSVETVTVPAERGGTREITVTRC